MINPISGDFSLANFYDVPKNWSEVQVLWPCSVFWTIDFYHFNSYATFTGWCDTVPDPKHLTDQFGKETFLKSFWNSPDIWAAGPGIQTPPPPPPPSPSTPSHSPPPEDTEEEVVHEVTVWRGYLCAWGEFHCGSCTSAGLVVRWLWTYRKIT
jgi:hypothetical protein